jgi:hypothetical protein
MKTLFVNWSLLDKCIIMVVVRDVQTVLTGLIEDVENLNTTIIFLLF